MKKKTLKIEDLPTVKKALAWFRKNHLKDRPKTSDQDVFKMIGLLALAYPKTTDAMIKSYVNYRIAEGFEGDDATALLFTRIAERPEYRSVKIGGAK